MATASSTSRRCSSTVRWESHCLMTVSNWAMMCGTLRLPHSTAERAEELGEESKRPASSGFWPRTLSARLSSCTRLFTSMSPGMMPVSSSICRASMGEEEEAAEGGSMSSSSCTSLREMSSPRRSEASTVERRWEREGEGMELERVRRAEGDGDGVSEPEWEEEEEDGREGREEET